MASQIEKIQELQTRVAEIAGEVRFNENLLLRSETVLTELVELNAECKSRNDVQDERMLRILEELKHNHDDIDQVKKQQNVTNTEVIERMDAVKRNIYNRLDSMEDKINALEKWRWFVLGAAALTILMIENINLIELFS
jgi:hypothetical protein